MEQTEIINAFGKPALVSYRTINLGNGSDDEQEEGILEGRFNGTVDLNHGRTIRYEFDTDSGARHYLFIDEILWIDSEPIETACQTALRGYLATEGK